MIQNVSLECDVCYHDKLLEEAQTEAEDFLRDRDWLLQVRVVRIMNKLIEHLKFTSTVSRVRHASFVAGDESGHNGLKAEIDSGSYDPNASDSRSSHTTSLNDVLFDFSTMDHASLLGLGHLDMMVMHQLCSLYEVDEVPDDMLIEGSGGDSGGNNGSDGGADDGTVVEGNGNGGDDPVDS